MQPAATTLSARNATVRSAGAPRGQHHLVGGPARCRRPFSASQCRHRCQAVPVGIDPSIAAIDVMAALPWLLNHPLITLGIALVLVVVVPRVVQTLWRALVIPVFVIAGVVATVKAPDTVGHTVQSLGSTVFSFVGAQPQLASAIVIGGMLLLLSSSIVPLLGAGFLFLLVFAPGQLTGLMPQLPSLPNVPSWAVPGPIKEIQAQLNPKKDDGKKSLPEGQLSFQDKLQQAASKAAPDWLFR